MRPIGLWLMSMTRSICSSPSIFSCGAGLRLARLSPFGDGFVQGVVDERRLAGSGDAGHAGHEADRNGGIDVLQRLLPVAPMIAICLLRVRRRCVVPARQSARCPDRYWPVSERGSSLICWGVPCATTWPPCTPAPGPRSTTWSAEQDRFLVVFDDDDGVADVAQVRQRAEQALVVALVQADRRLVEDVHDADQAGADLAGQPNALRFAAGQRLGAAIERQVVEADVRQEAHALADFLDDLVGDRRAPAVEFHGCEELARVADGQAGDFRQRPVGDEHVSWRRDSVACRRSPGSPGC